MNTETTISNRPMFKPSAETERLITALRQMGVNDVITYEEMRAVTGTDCQAERGHIVTARKHLLADDQRVFATIPRIGLKRLNDGDIVEQEGTTSIKVRRVVRGSMKRLATVNPESLHPLEAQRYRATSASLGAIALCVTPANIAKVTQVAINNGSADAKSTLSLFAK
jgi:hypothetical protein